MLLSPQITVALFEPGFLIVTFAGEGKVELLIHKLVSGFLSCLFKACEIGMLACVCASEFLNGKQRWREPGLHLDPVLGEEDGKRTLGFSLPSHHASALDLPPFSLLQGQVQSEALSSKSLQIVPHCSQRLGRVWGW